MEVVFQDFVPEAVRQLCRDRVKSLSEQPARDAIVRLVSSPEMEPLYGLLHECGLDWSECNELFIVFAECASFWSRAAEVDDDTGKDKSIKALRRSADKQASALLDQVSVAAATLANTMEQLESLDGYCNSWFRSRELSSFWPLIQFMEESGPPTALRVCSRDEVSEMGSEYYPNPAEIVKAIGDTALKAKEEGENSWRPGWNLSQKSSPRDYLKSVFDELYVIGKYRPRYRDDTDLIKLFTEPMLSSLACVALNIGEYLMNDKIAGNARRDWFKFRELK